MKDKTVHVKFKVRKQARQNGLSQAATASHQIAINQKHREIHQNPCGQHEDDSVKAQDVKKPQVVDSCVSQHLEQEEIMQLKICKNGSSQMRFMNTQD